jgi:N-acetylglucosaminyldiphosphoundecaprenol N-acetyl-beta-D-mannosaminyltransferase
MFNVRRILFNEKRLLTNKEKNMSDDRHYFSSKEEDIILEYNQVSLDDANIVNILNVSVDNLTIQQAVYKVIKMVEDKGVHHIMTLNPYKLMRIKANSDLRVISEKADMHIASGAGIQWAAQKLNKTIKERIPVLSFMMEIVRISEIKEYSIFLVGGKPEITERAFFNIRKSFPNIRIVGRHGGYFEKKKKKSVIEAIRKSEANIIFVGLGFPKEEKWIHKCKNEFKNAVLISIGGSIDIVSGEIKKAPPYFMENGLDWFYRIITRPWRIGRLLRTMLFFIRILFKRLISKQS